MANRLRPSIYAAAGVCVAAAVWVSADNLNDITNGYANRTQAQQRIDQLTAQSREVEHAINSFGVSPELVRGTVLLAQDELATAPSLAAHLHQLAAVISAYESLRLRQLNWHILAIGAVACSNGAAVPAPVAADTVPNPADPKRLVEISFEVFWPNGLGERARAQGIASLSAKLRDLPGASLITDPAQALALSSFSGGAGASDANSQALAWCLTLPETTASTSTDSRQP
jgi:hypothetical protein